MSYNINVAWFHYFNFKWTPPQEKAANSRLRTVNEVISCTLDDSMVWRLSTTSTGTDQHIVFYQCAVRAYTMQSWSRYGIVWGAFRNKVQNAIFQQLDGWEIGWLKINWRDSHLGWVFFIYIPVTHCVNRDEFYLIPTPSACCVHISSVTCTVPQTSQFCLWHECGTFLPIS